MIPKTVYQIWLGEKPIPDTYVKFFESWAKHLPDFRVVNIDNSNVEMTPYLQKLFDNKNYILATSYVRYYYLHKYGGVYFDNDVEVIKDLTPLLDRDILLGWEDSSAINTAVLGSVAGHPIIKECMDEMETWEPNIRGAEAKSGPTIMTNRKDRLPNALPPRYFYPYHYTEQFRPECITPDTYTIHHWAGSWTNHPKNL